MIHEVKSWKFKECFIAGNEECEHLCDLTHRFSTY